MVQILGHGDQMVLDVREIEPYVGRWCDTPVFVTSFRQSFHDVGFVAHQAEQSHHLLSTCSNPSQHVTLLRLFENEHKLIYRVDFVLDGLNQRPEGVGDVVDEGI